MINEPEIPTEGSFETKALLACLEVGKLLTSTLDLREILQLIVDRMSDLIAAENWSILLRNEVTGELTFEIVAGVEESLLKGIRLARGEGIAGYVADTGQSILVPNVAEDPRFSPRADQQTGFLTQSIACLPLQAHGKVVGVIEVVNVRDFEAFRLRDLPVLKILADYAAIAIQNARLFSRIEELSITDEYTGLHNARHLYHVLAELLERADADGTTVGVVFVDMDNFKSIVDRFGHLLGTRALREVGETMQSRLQPGDRLFKYGGDEFVLVLPGRDKTAAKSFVEGLCRAVHEAVFLKSEGQGVRVSASFGVAVYPMDAGSLREILMAADRALYTVKRGTKNAVAVG
ncbi:MAG: sensor domain-containing diguanylate cyclase [Acidobacteriota bacterium]